MQSGTTSTHVDRGGTFTDVVYVADGRVVDVRKVRSDQAVVGDLAMGSLTFGTTVATNALLEGTRGRTLLITSEGLGDLPWIRDMTRPSLFEPEVRWPEPLVDRVLEVQARLAPDGSPVGLLATDLPALDATFDGVAICLPHGPTRPDAEARLAEAAQSCWPDAHVVTGHEVSGTVGLLARMETALVDVAIGPVLQRALDADRIPPDACAIRSDGSLCGARDLSASEAVLSGPAGGVIAVAALARALALPLAVGFDMGGTSTDVCLVRDGALPRRHGHVRVAGTHLSRPILEVHTVAAGGGSVVAHDGRSLEVGPGSAGAEPGPQCYGRGGPPTVTDAALVAGRVDPDAFSPPLEPSAVRLPAGADDVLAVAHEQMAQAIRDLAAERGEDVATGALVAFGGAAGQHAADVAARCGIDTVWVHPFASVLSAWGQSLARREEEAVAALWRPLDATGWAEVCAAWQTLHDALPELGEVRRSLVLRHEGTDDAIAVAGTTLPDCVAAFHDAHRRRYGFVRGAPIEVLEARVRVQEPAPVPPAPDTDPWGLDDRAVPGPTRLDTPTTSIWVPEGWTARRDRGLLRLDRHARVAATGLRDPAAEAALWTARLMGVARRAGHVLQRVARSVNVRERLDFSCAVFDADGRLVANAPHVPVHLGAMGATVRSLIASGIDGPPQQQWVGNDPWAGGSHLPDLTVVRAVDIDGTRLFVANRAHHVDVGGLTPGSMPPQSGHIDDEGFVLRHEPLLGVDGLRREDLPLPGARQPDTVRADLDAQMAANETAARLLTELGAPLLPWLGALQDLAEQAVLPVLASLPSEPAAARDTLDGVPLAVAVHARNGRLVVDFTGTGGPHPGNLNAPSAVVRAAVLYVVRVLAGRGLPLNDGLMRRVDLVVPPGSLLDPPAGAAVAGGNVETSQRLVDLLLRATGRLAPSTGTMTNLTLGGPGWSLYETLGGGQGAGPGGAGASGRQVHMTNTRATDPEVLERRLPLRVHRMALRHGSGGQLDGGHAGGNGLVRELELLAGGEASLLCTRLAVAHGPVHGEGRAALAHVMVGGDWRPWDGASIELAPGDRVRVQTPGGSAYRP